MPCGRCDRIPDFEIFLIYYIGNAYRPWSVLNTGIIYDGAPAYQWMVPDDKVAYNLGGRVWNVYPDDMIKWEYSLNGGVSFIPISGGFGQYRKIPSDLAYWTELDSIDNEIFFPNFSEDGLVIPWRVTIQRPGCKTLLVSQKDVVITGTNIVDDIAADGWEITHDGVISHSIDYLGNEYRWPIVPVDLDYIPCGPCYDFADPDRTLDTDTLDCICEAIACKGVNVEPIVALFS